MQQRVRVGPHNQNEAPARAPRKWGPFRMKTALAVATALALIASTAGCATVTRGSTEVLVVNTDPGGAEVEISDGHRCRTPCSVELKRKHDYHVIVEKPGYERVDADVRSQIVGAGAAGMAGNVVLGGLIGAGVDAATGATRGLKPNPLDIKLVAEKPPAPTVSLALVPVEPACDQATKVDRATCRGTLRLGMTRDAVLGVLGVPDGKNADGTSLRYGEHHLEFAADGLLTAIVPPPH